MLTVNDCILTLHKKTSWFNKKSQLSALAMLSEIGTPYTVSRFFSTVFTLNKRLSNETAKTIHSLMLKVKPSEWTQLYPSFQYLNLNHMHLKRMTFFPESIAVELLGVASLNGVGQIRETAIHRLQKIKSPRRIPYILLRLNDWVEQVRQAAFEALRKILQEEMPEEFLQYIYVLDWMARVERVDLSAVRDEIIELLLLHSSQNLYAMLDHADKNVRLFCYQVLMKINTADPVLLEKGIHDQNPIVCSKMFQYLQRFPPETQKEKLPLFLQRHHPPLQVKAMMLAADKQWVELTGLIFENLFSSSALVRSTARYLLEKRGENAFADEYRRQLRTGQLTPEVISGLSETGGKEDFDTISAFVSNARPKLRSASVAGLYRTDKERSMPYLIEALKDPSAKVRRASVLLLCRSGVFETDSVRKILTFENPASRISALAVLTCSMNWESLTDILHMVDDADDKVRSHAWMKYIHWYQKRSARNWLKPSASILAFIEMKITEINQDVNIPDNAKKYWKDLPVLIESGKHVWGNVS